MARLRTFLALSPADRRLLFEAAARLLAARIKLALLPFSRLVPAAVSPTPRSTDADDANLARRVRWAVETAARNLPVALTCLPQAFAAFRMLKARGFAPSIVYGVARAEAEGFEAHAWVELNGFPIVGHRTAARFTPLANFPQNPSQV